MRDGRLTPFVFVFSQEAASGRWVARPGEDRVNGFVRGLPTVGTPLVWGSTG